MALDCMLGNHAPRPAAARNQGFDFSTCSRCGGAMVRSGRSWRRVPRGFRVVWRQPPAPPRIASDRRSGLARLRAPRRGPSVLAALAGLVDLFRAAVRVLLWTWADRVRGFGSWMQALPGRAPVLRLPAP